MRKKIVKFIVPLVLAFTFVTPIAAFADNTDNGGSITESSAKADDGKYLSFPGSVEETTIVEDAVSIKATNDDETVIFNISDKVFIYNQKGRRLESISLEKDKKIRAFYPANTPVALSIPAQMTPQVIIVEEGNVDGKVKVDFFDETGLSSDKKLQLNIDNEVNIVNTSERKVAKENIRNKNLLVFYSIETRSNPPQTTPEKIVVLGEADKTVTTETLEVQQKKDIYKALTDEDKYQIGDLKYVKLKTVADALGYKLEWNENTSVVTMEAEEITYNIVIGDKEYSQDKTLYNFLSAPLIINERTYVEEGFIDKLIAK